MISFTDAALRHFQDHMGPDQYLVFGLKRYGCSGYAYDCQTAQQAPEGYQIADINGLRVAYDPQAQQLQGLIVDYQRRGLNSTVVYVNPNEVARCGCGESVNFGQR